MKNATKQTMTFNELRTKAAEQYDDQFYGSLFATGGVAFSVGVDWCLDNLDQVPKVRLLIDALEDIRLHYEHYEYLGIKKMSLAWVVAEQTLSKYKSAGGEI